MIELDSPAALTPAEAPVLPEAGAPQGRAMQRLALTTAWRGSGLGRFFLASALSLVGILATVAAWNFVTGLLARSPVLGWTAAALFCAFLLAALLIVMREALAYARLARLDSIKAEAGRAAASHDLAAARRAVDRLVALYARRPDLALGRERLAARRDDVLDAETLLAMAETDLLTPLDQAARREIEAAALIANIRMIRRIAEIYGGRGGALGSWRLLRAVMTHLVATGAVAVGDDLIHSVAGGGLLSKLSRRFGEGVINGALTARVGVAAMDVCRPLAFSAAPRPKVSNLVSRGLRGLFGGEKSDAAGVKS